jgi:signal transduction histidine kinase
MRPQVVEPEAVCMTDENATALHPKLDAKQNSRSGWGRVLRLRRVSWLVLAIFVAAAIGAFALAQRLSDQQERRLLDERTSEVSLILSDALGAALQSALSSLASSAAQSPAAFDAAAKKAATGDVTVALLAKDRGGWVVRAAKGSGLSANQTLTGSRAAFVAEVGEKVHSAVLSMSTGDSRLAVAIGPPTAPAGTVIYEEQPVKPTQRTTVTDSQPFHELNAALYVGSRQDPKNLILTTASSMPLRGRVSTSAVQVGGDTWLVAASAREPLAGSLTGNMPAILLTAVLLIGLAMTALVEAVSRRRDYAVELVAERTAALRQSLDQLEQTQQALVASERLAALGQMAATVGHELRNPLGVLTNSLYLIRRATTATADERLHRQLDTADREVGAATQIVSDQLEFSRPRAANPISVDLKELLSEAVSVAPPPTGIHVEQLDDGAPPVVADRDQIRQVILNLLTNAYEAMPEGGLVTLGSRKAGDSVEIFVVDVGTGMDEATRAQVFEPFFSKKIKGTGLGLAVSKRIAEAHGGTLNITSEEGRGTTAVLALPLLPVTVGAAQ